MTIESEPTSDATPVFPEAVRDSTSTAAAVYTVLEAAGPLTYSQLVDETGASRTAVENAVTDLREQEIIESCPDPTNPRRQLHQLTLSFE
jgi:DNA-binding MarR family transcriptional regulator